MQVRRARWRRWNLARPYDPSRPEFWVQSLSIRRGAATTAPYITLSSLTRVSGIMSSDASILVLQAGPFSIAVW